MNKRCMNGELLLMLLGKQLGRFSVCHQDRRRKIETLGGGMRKCKNVLEERDWPKRTGITRRMRKKDRSTRMCRKVKRVVAKAKGKAFDELYEKLDAKEGKRTSTVIGQTERPSWKRCATG